jgi:hypothetical protein
MHFAPSATTIITETLPNYFLNLILVPTSIIEADAVPRQPHRPEGNTFE